MAQALTPDQARYLMDNGLRRVLRRDPDLPHQIVILHCTGLLGVSCNYKRYRGDGESPCSSSHHAIKIRPFWLPGEAIAVWREHLAEAEGAIA